MYYRSKRIAIAAVLSGLFCAGIIPVQRARGDFILWGNEELTVNTSHDNGQLYDHSTAHIVPDGSVFELHANHSSTVDLSGGHVSYLYAYDSAGVDMSGGITGLFPNFIYAYGSSTVDLSGGSVSSFYAYNVSVVGISGGSVGALVADNASAVEISGGEVNGLETREFSVVDLSGGEVDTLYARDSSTVTFNARDFRLGSGLSLDGNRVLGTGTLSLEWFDGTRWGVEIQRNDPGATIRLVPEPTGLALMLTALAVAGLLLPKNRFKRSKPM